MGFGRLFIPVFDERQGFGPIPAQAVENHQGWVGKKGGWEVGSDTLDILVLMLMKMTLPFSSGKLPQGCGTILGDHDPRVFRSWLCADKVKQTETVGREWKQLQS